VPKVTGEFFLCGNLIWMKKKKIDECIKVCDEVVKTSENY
jgi:hypothetical protein